MTAKPEPRKARPRSRTSKNRVTVKEVAERAGVAMMTVSRALRAPETVSEGLRQRIDAAVEELGYVPSRLAGALASARTRTVPVVIPSLSNLVFPDIVAGIAEVLQEHDLQMLLGHTGYSLSEEEALASVFLSWSPDGVIIAGVEHSKRTRRMLEAAGVPVVEIVELGDDPIDMNVGLSHFEAGAEMARYLMSRGYRRIGFVGTLIGLDLRVGRRLDGYRAAFAEAGLEAEPVVVLDRPSTLRLGGEAIAALLEHHPQTEAVFFSNDDLAAGAVLECHRRGIEVPGRIAIAGFNGLEFGSEIVPRLTTILTPRYEIGRRAAEMLVRRLAGEAVAETRVDLGFRLLKRESA